MKWKNECLYAYPWELDDHVFGVRKARLIKWKYHKK
jgi:hypothetical protein